MQDETVVTEGFAEEYIKATVTREISVESDEFDKSALPDNFKELIIELLIAKDIAQ